MVPLGKKQFDNRTAILTQPWCIGLHLHALVDPGQTSWLELVRPGDLDEAEAACPCFREAFQVAERWDGDPCVARCIKDTLLFTGTHQGSIDTQRFC
jgi:hypothetical protein